MGNDFNYVLRQKFDAIVLEAEQQAKEDIDQMIVSLQLNSGNILDQIVKLRTLDKKLDKEHEESKYAGYS